jgi:hypothetical protein
MTVSTQDPIDTLLEFFNAAKLILVIGGAKFLIHPRLKQHPHASLSFDFDGTRTLGEERCVIHFPNGSSDMHDDAVRMVDTPNVLTSEQLKIRAGVIVDLVDGEQCIVTKNRHGEVGRMRWNTGDHRARYEAAADEINLSKRFRGEA